MANTTLPTKNGQVSEGTEGTYQPNETTNVPLAGGGSLKEPELAHENEQRMLDDLKAKGIALIVHQDYEAASDCFSQAAELQSKLNGEMSPKNAEILYLYGRSLLGVAQSKSDILGDKAPAKSTASVGTSTEAASNQNGKTGSLQSHPSSLFQFEDDNTESPVPEEQFNVDDNDDGDEAQDNREGEEDEEEEEEEDEDDMAVAFNTLDLARILFDTTVQSLEQNGPDSDTSKSEFESTLRHNRERLADTYSWLAEISLENERYKEAIQDQRVSLELKQKLYPEESNVVAEAHFKLSLALEYASLSPTAVEDVEESVSENGQHQKLRDEAVLELKAAISSTEIRLANKEKEALSDDSPQLKSEITEIKSILVDLNQSLTDLKAPPVDIDGILGGSSKSDDDNRNRRPSNILEEAIKTATDVSSLIKKKPSNSDSSAREHSEGVGLKRKATETVQHESVLEDDVKKARV